MTAAAKHGDLIRRLCQEHGIDREYWDIWGQRHEVPEGTLLAILGSLGFDTSTPEALEASAREHEEARQRRPLDPVIVLSGSDREPAVPLRAPAGSRAALALYLEDGSARRWEAEIAETTQPVALPGPLPLGYHDL